MRFVTTCLATGCMLAAPAVAQPIEWRIDEGGNGHFYEAVLVLGGIMWDSARVEAESRGGYLATITSPAENSFVFDNVASDPALWILGGFAADGPWLGGFQDAGYPPDEGWRWVTSETWRYTPPGHPASRTTSRATTRTACTSGVDSGQGCRRSTSGTTSGKRR